MTSAQLSVLLFEDSSTDVLLLREALEQDALTDFALTAVDRLAQGFALLEEHVFDLILLDLDLPDSRGLDTFKLVHERVPNIPIVVCSGNVDAQNAVLAVRAGAQDYLVKGLGGFAVAARTIRHAIERSALVRSLRESEQRFAAVFRSTPAAQVITDIKTGEVLDVNDAYCRLTGFARGALLGHTTTELGLWVDPTGRQAMLDRLHRLGRVQDLEILFRTSDGEIRTQLTSIEPIELDGKVCIISTALDITERKQMEAALQNSERRFSTIFHNSPLMIAIVRLTDSRVTDANAALQQVIGYTRDEVIGRTALELHLWAAPEDRARLMEQLHTQGRVIGFETSVRRKSGELRNALISAELVEINHEPSMVMQLVDITKRNQIETALRDSNARFTQMAENTQEVFWMFDNHLQRLIYLNRAFETIWGRPIGDAYEDVAHYIEAIHPDDRPVMFRSLEKQARGQRTEMEYRIVRPDGAIRWIYDRSFPILDENGELVRTTGIAADITERKKAEIALRLSEEKYRGLMESLDSVIAT